VTAAPGPMSLAMSEAPRSTWSADVRARVHFAHVTVSGGRWLRGSRILASRMMTGASCAPRVAPHDRPAGDPLLDALKGVDGCHYSAGMTYGLFGKFSAQPGRRDDLVNYLL
jgi:hypothetical protein